MSPYFKKVVTFGEGGGGVGWGLEIVIFGFPLARNTSFGSSCNSYYRKEMPLLGRIQDLVTGGSDKRPPALSYCYCCLTSPSFKRKRMVLCFTLGGSTEPPEPPLDPSQH